MAHPPGGGQANQSFQATGAKQATDRHVAAAERNPFSGEPLAQNPGR